MSNNDFPDFSAFAVGGDEDGLPDFSDQAVGPKAPDLPIPQKYYDAIKGFEGFADVAKPDYKQHSNGYGTKALYPGERISKEEAERRYHRDITKAAKSVDSFLPDLSEGVRASLVDLTFNSGEKWQRMGLGAALQAGDMEEAGRRFNQYVNAGGVPLDALINRRADTYTWWRDQQVGGSDSNPDASDDNLKDILSATPEKRRDLLLDEIEKITGADMHAYRQPKPKPAEAAPPAGPKLDFSEFAVDPGADAPKDNREKPKDKNALPDDQKGVFGDLWGILAPEERLPATKEELASGKSQLEIAKSIKEKTGRALENFTTDRAKNPESALDWVLRYNPAGLIGDKLTEWGLLGADAAAAARVESQEKRIRGAEDALAGKGPLVSKSGSRAAVEGAIESAATMVPKAIEYYGQIRGYLNQGAQKIGGNANPAKVEDDVVYKFGKNLEDWLKEKFPGDAARQHQFGQQVAQGVGSTVGFWGPGAITKLLGAGEKAYMASIALSGIAAQSADVFNEITEKINSGNATEKDRIINWLSGIPLGASEALPFAPTIGGPIHKLLGGRVAGALEQGIEESLQEGFQGIGGNYAAQKTYDPERNIMEGVPEGMAVGLLTGLGGGAALKNSEVPAQAAPPQRPQGPSPQPGPNPQSPPPQPGAPQAQAPVAAGPTPAAQARAAGPSPAKAPVPSEPVGEITPEDIQLLIERGWKPDALVKMGEDELRAEIEDARTQVGTPLAPNAPRQADAPSAEPVSDIEAQILSMRAGERDGVYLSAANVENLQSQPEFVNRIAEALNSAEGAQIVQNVDGKGGIMVAANADVARNIEEAVKAGVDVQTVLGEATGAGTGKPADATAVVQQKTPEGAVTRESLVTPDQVAETEKEFAGPAKTVETVTPEQAIARREEKIAEEKQTGPMVSRVPTFQDIAEELPKDEDGLPNYQALSDRIKEIGKKGWPDLNVMEKAKLYREFAGQGTGTRAAPVTVETADDLELVSNEADSEYTPAQGEANNRKLGHAKWNGLDLSIETKAGGVRKGVDKETGKTWETTMGAAYGYIRGTSGADNMHVDAYVGTDVNSGRVFIIDEVDNKTGKFRQHKTFIGFPDEASAVAAYTGTSSKTPDMIGAVTEMSADEFRDWVLDGKKTEPLGNIEKPDFSSLAVEPEAPAKPKSETIAPPTRYEGEPLSEMEIDAIVGNWKYVQEVSRRPRPQSLSSYVIDNGGLRDDAREVRHIAGSAKERPGLINSQGETLDDAARSAWEAGFFTGDRPEIAEFLDALQDDLHSGEVVREQDLHALEDIRIAEDIEQELADYGVTTNRFRSEASLREYFGQERPRTARETETDQEAQAPAKERKGRTGDVEEAPFDLPAKGEKAKPFDPYSFSVQAAYAKQGEEALKKRLADFGVDELKQIVSAQNFGVKADVLDGGNAIALRKAIVEAAREKLANRMAASGGMVEGALKKPDPIKAAGELGRKAFEDGKSRTPALNKELQDFIGQNDGRSMEIMEAYTKAWDKANLAAPVSSFDNLPDGYSVELSDTRLKGDEARIKGGEYKAVAVRKQPAGSYSAEAGYGSTPEEAMRNALAKVGYKPGVTTEASGQTSIVPEATTKEKIAAEAKAKEKKGGNEPMDEGLFGSSKDQLDLVDAAKQPGKETEDERADSQDQEKQTGDTPDSEAYETLADIKKAVADGKVKSQPDREHRCYKYAGQKALDGGYDLVLGKVGDEKIQHGVARTLDEKYIYDPQYDVWMAADVYAQAVSGFEEEFVLSASDVQTFLDDFNVWPSMAMLEKHGWLGGEAIEESATTAPEEPVETSKTEQKPVAAKTEAVETKPQEAVSLQDALRDHLLGEGFSTIIEARKFAKDHGFEGSTKDVDELVEQAVVAAARQIVSKTGDVTAAYQALVGLYNNQPNLAVRTSTSVTNQAYSTPAPLAYLASRLAGVADASHVLEPTAGNGMLLIEADPNTVEANEIDPKRAKALRDQNFATVKSVDATDPAFTQAKSADSVIMNPPFGAVREDGQSKSWTVDGLQTSAIDHAIALNALHAMTDDGKAVIIMGGVNAESIEERRKGYRGQSKRLFFAKLYKTYNVTDHFTVSGDLYKKQGAGWPVDVVVISGRGQSERPLPAAEPPVILKTWDDLKGKLPDVGTSTKPIRGSQQATDADNRPAGGTDLGKRGSESGDGSGRPNAVGSGTERLPAGTEDKPAGVRADRDRGQPADVSKGVGTEPDSAAQSVRDRRTANERPAPRRERLERTAPPEGSGQALYEPSSSAASLDTLIPVNMAQATKSALSRVEARHGSLDAFVAEQLGYTDDLSKYFSAEQVDAIAAAIDNIERGSGYILGDQCVGGETLIFDPITGDHTPIQVLTERGEPISVLSLTNDGFAARSATSPFLKGVADLYRVTFDDGSSITVTRGHRFLTSNGWASLDAGVEVGTEIASFSPTGLLLDRAGSIHQACAREDARHSSDKAQDCLSHYSRDLHLCDERSLSAEDSDLVSAPSQGDVLEHTRCYSHRDGQDVSAECIRPRRDIDRHSKNSSSPLESRGPSLISSQEPASSEQLSAQIRQVPSPFDCDSGPLHQEDGASAIGQLAEKDRRLSSFSSTNNTAYRRVVAIQFDRHDAFFDMHVPGAFNYVANGVVNHNTGIGKGRVVAATIRYAIRKGWTPVFVTEKPDLYGDMFRDMADIGLQKMLGHEPRALMTNTGESVPLDEEALAWKQEADQARADGQPIPKRRGRFLTAGGKPAQEKAMQAMASGKGQHDIVFTTYDQMNTIKKQETDRRRFLRQIAHNSLIILDESHNAGGQGEKLFKAKHGDAPDRAEYVRGLVKDAAGVVYSSATFAKRPDVMDLYARTDMGKAVDDPKMLPALIQKGGVPMQQIVASMLSNAGQYMRRERSFEGVEYAVEPVPVDEKTYKQFSDAVRAVFEFDLAVEDIRDEVMEDILDKMGATKAKDAGVGGGSANSIAFAAIMHNIVNQMLLSIKARQVAQRAIDAHKAGEKPVIALAGTMESFISDYAEDAGISIGQPIAISFGDVLQRYLSRTLRITVKDSDNQKKHVQIPISDLPPSLQRKYAEAEQLIKEGDFDSMPVSPIDAIRHELTSAGLSVAEVTGRKVMIDYGAKGNSAVLIDRPKSEIGPSGKRSSIAAFNRGGLDALILNRSGSTGVSMHASKAFKDQSPRRMIIAQAEANIDTHLQMLGRVHRTGQVIPPSYSQIAAEIPAEARPTAVLMKKMASLNANTTGARGSVFMADSIDFMNEYGDKVVANIIQDEPEINAKLGNPLKENDKGLPVSEDAARRVTGRLVLLTPKEQTELLNRIQDEYKAEIERLDALGENALEAKTVDLKARHIETTALKDRTGEGPFLDSAQIEKVSIKSQGRAMAPKEVAEKISEALEITTPEGEGAAQLAVLERSGREWMNKKIGDVRSRSQSWIASDVASKSDDAKVTTKKRHDDQLARWIQTAQVVAPGARVTLQLGDRQMHAIVLSVARTGKAKNPVALGAWSATMAVPDSVRTLTLPFSQLFPPSQVKGSEESGAEVRFSQVPFTGLISQLEDARREGREDRYIVTGNILAGYDQVHGKGQIVNFTMEDGTLRPGILMSRDFQLNKFMNVRTVRLKTGAQIAEFLAKAPLAEVQTSDKYVTFSRPRGDYVIETAAGRATGGQYYTDTRVRDALQGREFVRSGGIMRVTMPDRAAFERVVEAIRKVGGIFETKSDQDLAQEIVRKSSGSEPAYAIGGRDLFDEIEDTIYAGKTYVIPYERVVAQMEDARPHLNMVPSETIVGVLERITPVGDSIDPLNQLVKLRFMLPNGKFVNVTYKWTSIADKRALTQGFDDRLGIFFLNTRGLAESGKTLGGEVWHEVTHILRKIAQENVVLKGVVTDDVGLSGERWHRLLAHANKLHILDRVTADVLKVVGVKNAGSLGTTTTLRQDYSLLYHNRPDKVELIRQESVAHMLELWHHGAISDEDMAPVMDIIEDIRSGRLAGNPAFESSSDPTYAIGKSQSDQDSLGYYSKLLRAAYNLKQEKGTPEQMLAQLKDVKESEIEATGLRAFLEGKKAVTKSEIINYLSENRVELQEKVYLTPKWANLSVDPNNPTYQETVLHLPSTRVGEIDKRLAELIKAVEPIEERLRNNQNNLGRMTSDIDRMNELRSEMKTLGDERATLRRQEFNSGHWSEPNVVAHTRTQILTDSNGRKVFNIDELQSDWAQAIRDKGAREEEKIASLKARKDQLDNQIVSLRPLAVRDAKRIDQSGIDREFIIRDWEIESDLGLKYGLEDWSAAGVEIGENAKAFIDAMDEKHLVEAEIPTTESAPINHPLVSTTDQWTATALRRVIRMAVEAGADAISITPASEQKARYRLSNKIGALRYDPEMKRLEYREVKDGRIDAYYSRFDNDGKPVEKADLPNIVGKEVAERLLAEPRAYVSAAYSVAGPHTLTELGEIGGTGMSATYDVMYPRALGKLLAKIDPSIKPEKRTLRKANGREIEQRMSASEAIKQGFDRIPALDFTVFPITDKVRSQVLDDGQTLFAIGGRADPVVRYLRWAENAKPATLSITDKAGKSYRFERRPVGNGSIYYRVFDGSKEVASFYVRTGGAVFDSISVMNAKVDENYQRRGIASAAYDAIEADTAPGGLPLYPQGSLSMSQDALAFWRARNPDRLAEMRDTEIQPFGRTVASIYASKVDATSKDQIETAIQDALEIVGRIAGRNINVDLKPTIPVGAALDASSRADLEASGQDLPETAGGYYKTVRNGATGVIEGPHVIGLAFEDPRFDLRTTAGHEAWHHVETALSTPQEMRLLQSPAEMARMTRLAAKEAGRSTAETSRLPAYEIRALAFQNYRRMREEGAAELSGLHIGVRRFFERIAKTLAAIRNALKGMGYASFEDIFERARTGETAARADRQEAETKEQQLEQAVKSAMQSSSNNNPDPAATINAFIDQRMARDDGNAASQVQAYHAYSLWADEAGLELPTIEEFDKAMLRQGVRRMVLANDDVRYIGLRVVEEAEEKPANPSAKIEKDAFQIAKELALGMSIEGAIEKQIEKVKSVIGEKPDFARLALLQTLKANDNANENIHQNIISMGSVMPRMPSNPLRGTLQRRALRMLARVANISDAARVRIQDKALPIRRLAVERVENETGAAVPVSLDTYISEGLYHGRAGERLNDLKQDRIEPLLEHMRASGLTLESVGDYLYARHAFERNDAIRQIDPDNDAGSGMTDEEAATILDRWAQSGRQADMDAAVRMVDTIIDDALNTLLRSGLIDRTTYDEWREKYPNYVPLRGFDLGVDENPDRPRAGRGFDLRGPESKQALGRRSKADNPLVYTIMQAEEAIIRAEKNRVAKTLYKMIQANPNPAVWELYRGEAKRRVNPSTGLVETYWVHPPFVRNDAVHGVKINGKQFWMELKHPALARAMRGVGSEWNGSVIGRAMMTLTRTYASLLTSYNPEFVLGNFFRDLETSLINVSDVANKPAGLRRKILKDATSLKSIRGALAAVRDYEGRTIFGTHRRADENILGLPKSAAAQEYARWYDEFRLAGGKISFMEFNDVERIKHRINADLKAGRMKRALRGAAEYVENLNTAVENGVRLSTYVALRRAGIEQDRAAFTARELTVNFNRRGEWGPAINSMYLFFNASVQGSTRVAQAFVKSKAVRYGVASIFAAGMALDLFNFLAAGDGDDGENKYDAIPDWIKERNVIIMNPFGDDYIMIPMAYGYNVPYVAGLKATEMVRGKTSPLQAAASVAGQVVDSFNPMGTAESFYQLVSPTVVDPAIQVLENKTWYGGPIYPTKYDKRKPESENYFTSAPWWAIDMAKTLNSVTGGNHRRSGWFDVSPEVIEHYAEFAGGGVAKFVGNAMNSGQRMVNGDEWLPEKTPFLRRLYGKPTSEGRKRDFYELWDDANRAKYEAQSDDKEVAEAAREKYAAELRVYGAAKGAKETLKALRAQRDKIRADNKLDHDERQAKLNDIIEREKALISRVLKLYRDAKSQQTEKESTP